MPGPGYDFLRRGRALVRPLAEGRGQRARWTSRCSAPGWARTCRPQPFYADRPGRWVGEDRRGRRRGSRRGAGCSATAGSRPSGRRRGSSRLPRGRGRRRSVTGLAGGEWCPYGTGGRGPGVPGRPARGRRAIADLGRAAARRSGSRSSARRWSTLELAVDRPSAFVAVRLCDVAPDGASTRVTFGVLNLTHRDGHDDPRPMVAGRARRRSGSSSTTRRRRSCPAIGCGSRSRPTTGRWSGRRPSRSR